MLQLHLISQHELQKQDRTQGGEGGGSGDRTHPLAGQIISKACRFSPETEFTPLILASKS